MLRIRLQRRGKSGYAAYRVVVAERGAPVKGRFVADLGPYNPHTDAFIVDKEKALEWINKGAQPTPTVHNLMVEHKIIKGKKVTSWRPKKKEGEATATASAPAPALKAKETKVEEKPAEKAKEAKPEEKPEAKA